MRFPATHKYLKLFQAANGGASYYRVAQLLEVSRQAVYDWRDDKNGMSEETGMMLADRLNLDVVEVVTELNADRANTRESRSYYSQLLERLKSSAALAAPAFIGVYLLLESNAILI
jgi:predicted transcriptional regulator